jgi:murein DD-endopeptidase MepM/ murein hydrolase activator NlpD
MSIYRKPFRRPWQRFYVVSLNRLILSAIIFLLSVTVVVLLLLNFSQSAKQYRPDQIPSDHLSIYFELEKSMGIPWYYLAAIDKAERVSEEEISKERSAGIALHLTGIRSEEQLPDLLNSYKDNKAFIRRVERELEHFSYLRLVYDNKVFPFAANADYTYEDGYGDNRTYGGERNHEGIDLMTDTGVPILSVCEGVIEQVGWLELGGYRIGIRGKDNVYYYYAHMSRYDGKPEIGDKVKKGQLIGFVGDTGYGPEGTTGKFDPHLHFGMYYGKKGKMKAFNPYPFLQAWER